MGQRIVVTAATISMACGTAPEPREGAPAAIPAEFPEAVSGSRLRAVRVVTVGLRIFEGWHDLELDARCSFAHAEDGALRCLPEALARSALYADAACTVPLAAHFAGCPGEVPPVYLADHVGTPCAPRVVIHRRGERHLGPVWGGGGASCVPTAVPSGYELYLRGEPLEAGRFVRAEVALEGHGRIASRVELHDDGSRLVVGPHDVDFDTPAREAIVEDGSVRWIPEDAGEVTGYADPSCQEALAAVRCAPPPLALVPVGSSACDAPIVRLRSLGAPYSGGVLHRRTPDGQCLASPASTPLATLAADISPDAVERAEAADQGGRVRLALRVASDGRPVSRRLPWHLRDAQHEAHCRFLPAVDGVLRCLPFSIPVQLFLDGDCEVPLAVAPQHPCFESSLATRFEPSAPGCEAAHARAFHLGPERLLELVHVRQGDACVAIPAPPASRLFELGDELPPEAFAEGAVALD